MERGNSNLDGQGASTAADPDRPSKSNSTSTSTPPAKTPPPALTTFSTAAAAAAVPDFQQNGDKKIPDAEYEMSNHRPPEEGHHYGLSYPPSLPSSTAYPPSVGMHLTSYSTYSSPTSQPGDVYRASPTAASSHLSLPSMRTIDSMAQQASQNMNMNSDRGENLPGNPLPSTNSMTYYPGHQPSMLLPSNYGTTPESMARYALTPDPRMLHRPPKKEIKRRTKTGCLTCRKRRIKCDETHPTCNNCKKSKRDCLGYDPIFRPQTVSNNSNQSPTGGQSTYPSVSPSEASQSQPPPASSRETSAGPSPVSASASYTPGAPLHSSYGCQPPYLTSNYGSPHAVLNSSLPLSTAAPSDPYIPSPLKELPALSTAPSPDIKTEPGEAKPAGAFGELQDPQRPPNGQPSYNSAQTHAVERKNMKVEELLDTFGPPPPVPQAGLTEETYQEVVKVYHEMYAPGFDAFFESTWFYFTENGKMSFPRYGKIVGHMAVFLKVLEGVKANDHTQMAYSGVLELRLVWELAKTAASAAPDDVDNYARATLAAENDSIEAKQRFRLVEALLSGELLLSNPLTRPVQDANTHRMRQFEFWYQLGEFLRRPEGEPSSATTDHKPRDEALGKLRWLLDGRENRDVLYSIAVLRHHAHRLDMSRALASRYHLPEEDLENRVVVAAKFITAQSHVTGGTTNVVRRICDIASRLYVNPRDNIGLASRPTS